MPRVSLISKAVPKPTSKQRLIQDAIRHTIVFFFVGEQRGFMRGDSVDQTFDERWVQV